MAKTLRKDHALFLIIVGVVGWMIPAGGYFLLRQNKRAVILFVTIALTFCIGLYVGSIGVIDLVGPSPVYVKAAQVLMSPVVFLIAHFTAGGGYPVYGRPGDMGEIYTMTSGLLNLLCIVNAVYLAHVNGLKREGN